MADDVTLLYLHGVRDFEDTKKWRDVLADSLLRAGYAEPFERVNVVAPRYGYLMIGVDEVVPMPPILQKLPTGAEARDNRRAFERRVGSLEFALGRHERGAGWAGAEVVIGAAVGTPLFRQAQNYLDNDAIRAAVLTRVLKALPDSGRLVVVGHSLGSIIAADLIRRIPSALKIVGLVTLGSPVASGRFNVDDLRSALKDPPSNLGWWVNFWNPLDPVAAHRGASAIFPWMADFKVLSRPDHHVHDAEVYLADESVARAIGFGLFGSLSKEVALRSEGVERPMEAAEVLALLALRYAHLIAGELDGQLRSRYCGALRVVQAGVVADLRRWSEEQGLTVHAAVAALDVDLSIAEQEAIAPEPITLLSKDEAAVPLVVVATENVVRPFDIAVSDKIRQRALGDLTAEMHLGRQYGLDVFDSVETAADALSGGPVLGWLKWGALGAGAAVLVLATGGLALAAGPGLVGAAALTSALATFGPGGMVGGLLTAGALTTVGGGGVALGLASPGVSAQSAQVVISRRLATADLRRRQGLEADHAIWRTLTDTETRVRREFERLDEFSDADSPSLKELKAKITAVERALKFLRAKGLEPDLSSGGHES